MEEFIKPKQTIFEYLQSQKNEDSRELTFYTLNFTITFNPYKFTTADTFWDAPMYFAKYINRVRYFHKLWFVFESHENMRKHLHGQLQIAVPINNKEYRFEILTNISKWVNARLGRSDFLWNNEQIRDSTYPTWIHYCFKENPEHVYWVFNNDPAIYQKSALDFQNKLSM